MPIIGEIVMTPLATSTRRVLSEAVANNDRTTILTHALVDQLRERLNQVLGALIPSRARVAIVGFPEHNNVGDSAMWLGLRHWLRGRGCRVIYQCSERTYLKDVLTAKLRPDDVIVLFAGGSFGNIWPDLQRFAGQVLDDFPDRLIIQTPHSLYFSSPIALRHAKVAYAKRKNLVLLARGQTSLELATNDLVVRATLCPDLAFALGSLARPTPPTQDVLWLIRNDPETRGYRTAFHRQGIHTVDWSDGPRTPVQHVNRFLMHQFRLHPRKLRRVAELASSTFEAVAQERLRRGLRLLSQGQVVVTDRLHGHLLSMLLGIPHVALDNYYGKVDRFVKTWTSRCPLIQQADTPGQALELAGQLLRSRPNG